MNGSVGWEVLAPSDTTVRTGRRMSIDTDSASRRGFLTDVGRLASVVALAGCTPPAAANPASPAPGGSTFKRGDWDLRWIETLRPATDRAVFDWPSMGD